MQRSVKIILGLCVIGVLIGSDIAEARRPRRGAAAAQGPLNVSTPFDPSLFETPWGPGVWQEYGQFAPIGGTWDDLLKSGPTAAIGAKWKYADFSGDLLPPSSTYFTANYRYAYMKGDEDAQLVNPLGAAYEVENMRLNLVEFGVSQKFMGPSRRGLFVDVGTGVGLGGAHAKVLPVAFNPLDTLVDEPEFNKSSVLVRGEVNGGFGLQLPRMDIRFGISLGLSGTSALSDGFRSQGDAGARLSGTWYLWE
ncbi:MAG: hypothetical protein ACK5Q5_07375 [Planctomycetaceae bacterium]